MYNNNLPSCTSVSANQDKRTKFEAVFPVLCQELLAYLKQEGTPADAIAWFQRASILFVPFARA